MKKVLKKILEFLLKWIFKFFKFLHEWNELYLLPLAFIVFWISVPLLRKLDPTAGTYDYGIFQIPLFAIINYFIGVVVVWLSIRITFPKIYKFFDNFEDYVNGKEGLTLWQKTLAALFVFFGLLLAYVLMVRIPI